MGGVLNPGVADAGPGGLGHHWFPKRLGFVCGEKSGAKTYFLFFAAVELGLVILWGGAKEAARIGFCLGGGAGAGVWVVIGPYPRSWDERLQDWAPRRGPSPWPGWFLLG